MSESQGQRIGRTRSLPDAVALLRAQRLAEYTLIRVTSKEKCGDIVVEQQKNIIDALVDGVDCDAQQALIALLSVTDAEFEVVRLDDADKDDFRHTLYVSLKTVGQGVPTSAERRALIDASTTESHALLAQDVRRERPIFGWQTYRRIKDNLVDTSFDVTPKKSSNADLVFPLLLLLVPIVVVGYFLVKGTGSLPGGQSQQGKQVEAPAQAPASASSSAAEAVVASVYKRDSENKSGPRIVSLPSVGEAGLGTRQLDLLNEQMGKAQKLDSEGKRDEAITVYADIVGRFPKYVQARIAIIKAYILKGDYKQATYYCKEGQRKAVNPSDYRYFSQLLAKIPSAS